jgi:hypothetical protein
VIPLELLDPRRRAYVELCRQEKLRRLRKGRRVVSPDELYGPPSPRYNPQPRHLEVEAKLKEGRRHNLLVGGSRSGKTFIICKRIIERALLADASDHLIARYRANSARASIWLGTLPMVRRICFPNLPMVPHPSDGYFSLPNESRIWVVGLDERERVEKILGNEFASVYPNEASQIPYSSILVLRTRLAQVARQRDGTMLSQQEFVDLNPVGKSHYSYREWIQGINPENRRPIPDHERDYYYAFLQPQDNAANLAPAYLNSLSNMPDRTRRRFYEGQYVEEVESALWTMEALDHARTESTEIPETLDRVVVAIDPSGTDGDEDNRSDDVGIVAAGREGTGEGSRGWLLEDATCNEPPLAWGRRAIALYNKWGADKIVAEANFGGEMVRAVIDAAARSMNVVLPPVELVRASRGKAIRAEPVSVLVGELRDGEWHGARVRHAGEFVDLEEELLGFSTYGYTGVRSPNRADAYVWAFTELLLGEQSPKLWSRSDLEVVE